jgi:hypothetical protein
MHLIVNIDFFHSQSSDWQTLTCAVQQKQKAAENQRPFPNP